jgi:Ca-activated chloride channel family protein
MTRALFVAAVLAIAVAVAPSAQQPLFRSGTDMVGFGVTVTDRRGNFITDLKPEDLEVVEEGTSQAIQLFARGDDAESAPELHIGLVFDTSGSMGDDITLARSAAVRFLNTLTDAKDMTLVDFDTEIRVSKYEQASFPRLVERIRARKPDGLTALYDAVGVYLTGASDDQGRKILVMFTDGGDTRSTTSFSKLITMLRASDATVYAVGFLEHQSNGARGEQRQRIAQIALETGGEAFFPTEMKHVDEAYAKILKQIRAQYTIGYISTNAKQDGRWRKVEIKVRRSDIQGPKVQARKGYYAPLAEP